MNDSSRELDAFFASGITLLSCLEKVVARFGAQAGTVHFSKDGALKLAAHVNIPLSVVAAIETVPIGTGMAGLAAQRREPVQVCNLQTDDAGAARPGARATQMAGSIAVPMLVADEVRGVLGIAKSDAHEWSGAERAQLLELAARLAQRFFQGELSEG